MGKLTTTDKYAIQGMLRDNKTTKQISTTINKPQADVEKYINKELSPMLDKIVSIKIESEKQPLDRTEKEGDIVSAVRRKLISAGLTERDVDGIMRSALAKTEKVTNEDELYTACISRMNAGSMMIKKSTGGREGVCIMTPGASGKNDGKTQSNGSRKADGNLWNIKEGKIINGKEGKFKK